jgi:mono/diheme cytochrome c family protein
MFMRFVRIRVAPILTIAAAVAVSVALDGSGLAADAQKGKTAFIQNGCWQCHDYAGEGSIATSNGKVIARTALPLDAFISFVRNTNGQMPPYRTGVISDEELTDIYAYLQSLPLPKAAGDIPLLKDLRTQ